jgi:hypothetical protein
VEIRNSPYVVVGVLRNYELWNGPRNALEWKNRACFIPLSTMIRRFKGRDNLSALSLMIKDMDHITQALDQVRNLLLTRHGVEDFKFETR